MAPKLSGQGGDIARGAPDPPSAARSQRDDFTQHAKAVVEEVDFAAFVMIPVHRNFPHSELRAPRQIKQLEVEPKPLGLGLFENRPANIETERLESALGVPKRKTRRHAHDKIENATALFATPGLPMADLPPVQGAV